MSKRARANLKGALTAVLSLLLIIAGLFSSLALLIHSEGFFTSTFEALNNAPAMGMSTEDLTRATMQMIYYMDGSADSIDLTVTVNGQQASMFNDKERAHMVDVRTLYQGWRTAAILFAVAYLLYVLYHFLLSRDRRPAPVARAFLRGSIAFVCIAAVIGTWVAVDFNSFWNAFHHLFFSNDLWLLNPTTDRMIQMMPLGFFYRTVLQFALRFLIPWALLLTGAIILVRRDKRRQLRGSRIAIRRAVEQHLEAEGRRGRE